MVDERTQMKFSDFFQTKNAMVEPTCEKFRRWKQAGFPVKNVQLDNYRENKLLKARCDSADWKLGIDFEFTARDTPQQNHLAELAFATLASCGRALMHAANIPMAIQYLVWHEAFKMATLLDGLSMIELDGKSAMRVEHWCGKVPAFAKHLKTWGEAGTVKVKTMGTPKIADRGVHCMFVGYALNHAGDCYCMWDPVTKRVHETRDVIWLKHMYYAKPTTGTEFIAMPIVIDNHEVPSVSAAGPVIPNNLTIKVGEGDTQLVGADANEAHTNEATEANETIESNEPRQPSQPILNPSNPSPVENTNVNPGRTS